MDKNEKWGSLAKLIALITVVMIICGCASLSKDECLNADWFSIGYEDGAKGRKASKISSHRKACAKHGVTPDFATYEKGRQKGLGEWCTPRNGYNLGERGYQYSGVCPAHLESAFLKAYKKGKNVYSYATRVSRQKQDLKNLDSELEGLEVDLTDLENALVKTGVSPSRRRQLLEEIRILEEDQRALQSEIADMEAALEEMESHLNLLRSQNPYR